MIDINLLPFELRPIKHTPLPYLLSIAVLIAVGAATGLTWQQTRGEIGDREAILNTHRGELEDLKSIVDEFNELSEQKVMLAERMEIIQEIVNDRIIWSQELWKICTLTPRNVWYSGIEEKEKRVREQRMVYNEKTKKEEPKTVTVTQRILDISGYIVQSEETGNELFPLLFAMADDMEFSRRFQLTQPWSDPTEFDGYPVRKFTLEFLIKTGADEDNENKEEEK